MTTLTANSHWESTDLYKWLTGGWSPQFMDRKIIDKGREAIDKGARETTQEKQST